MSTTTYNKRDVMRILKNNGYNCYLGGNIGIPLFTKLNEMKPEDIIVLELSSFQLMDMDISPDIAAITNITPNHLDMHKDYQEYIDAKKNIMLYQGSDSKLIVNKSNIVTESIGKEAKGKLVRFSSKENADIMLQDNYITVNGQKYDSSNPYNG